MPRTNSRAPLRCRELSLAPHSDAENHLSRPTSLALSPPSRALRLSPSLKRPALLALPHAPFVSSPTEARATSSPDPNPSTLSTRQVSRVGELRSALAAKAMTEANVYAELGEIVNGSKKGRESDNEIIVCDLTGTGAQDAAIGQVAWQKLSQL